MIDSDTIAAARSVRIEDEVAQRGIKLRGNIERVGPCPQCGGRDRFGINTRKQVFNCRHCGAKGDVLALVQWLDRVNFAEAVATLSGDVVKRRQVTEQPKPPPASPDEYEQRQAQKAGWMWSRRRPITGSPVETYLRQARRHSGPLPATLAYLAPAKPEHHPAMIAAFGVPDEPEPGILGEPRGVASVHLTLLEADGSGKADVEHQKLIIGRPLGRPIVLAPANDLLGLTITEGIEDALSVHAATGLGAWAASAAPFLPALADTVPDYIEAVHVVVDDDCAGRKHALNLVDRLRARGFEVFPRLLRSPEVAA